MAIKLSFAFPLLVSWVVFHALFFISCLFLLESRSHLQQQSTMSTATLKTGEPLSAGVQALQDIENNFTTGGYGALPGYILSGKGSTLKVCQRRRMFTVDRSF